jgi:hypothetical protein
MRSVTCLTLLNMTDRDVSNRFTSGTVPERWCMRRQSRVGLVLEKGNT